MSSILYICATPIGNMEDITIRTLNILKSVDLIAAEDTRTTAKLLAKYDIKTPTTSYHEHNKTSKGKILIEQLEQGKEIALVSDAGMPGISDPGEDLIKLCYEADIKVTVSPGATAGIMALVLSGLPTRRFVFEGFLPADKKERKQVLSTLEKEHRTMIFYEAPHRIQETLATFETIFGANREIAIGRELTKKFEEIRKGTIGEELVYWQELQPKGEFVLIVSGYTLAEQRAEQIKDFEELSIKEHMELYLKDMDEKEAMKRVAKDRGVGKREIYKVWKK